MPAAITEFVDISISLSSAAADAASFGTLMGVFDHGIGSDRQAGPFSSVEEVVAAGFTSVAEPEVNAWATAVFAQDDALDAVLIGREDSGDADWTATMTAIEAEDPDSWYFTTVETRAEAEIALVAAWIEARQKIFIAQSSDAEILAGTAGNVALDLQAAGYNRTALIYHSLDDSAAGDAPSHGYLDGAWASSIAGLDLDAPNGVGIAAYRQLDGIPFDAVSSGQASEIFGADANLFGRNKGLNFTSKGTMASSRFIDVTTSLDWLKARLEEEILSAFVATATKIPYTNAGINITRAAAQEVFDRGVSFGHLSADQPATITLPDVATVSNANKANRALVGVANGVLAGAQQKFTLNITIQQ